MPGRVEVQSSIPNDAKGVMWGLSDDERTILLILESEEFGPIPVGQMPPEIDSKEIMFTRLEDGEQS